MGNQAPGSGGTPVLERELRRVLYEAGVIKTNESDLVSCTPAAALTEYLDTNPESNLPSTMRTHKSRLTTFVEWCTTVAGIETLTAVQGDDLTAFTQFLKERGYALRTIESQLETLRVFLRFCRAQDYVGANLPYLVPDIDGGDGGGRTWCVDRERALAIIEHLATFQYASREHVVWLLLAEKGLRTCTLVALDVDDYVPPARDDDGYLDLRHRPDTGTRLKNGVKSERELALAPTMCAVLDDYLGTRESTERMRTAECHCSRRRRVGLRPRRSGPTSTSGRRPVP